MPILLGTLVVLEGIEESERVYDIIFVVVAFSVLVQGTSIPWAASRLGVPMRDVDPSGLMSWVVADGASAAGRTLRELPLGERTWVYSIGRDGMAVPARGGTRLEPGDELDVLVDIRDVDRLAVLFSADRGGRPGGPEEAGG